MSRFVWTIAVLVFVVACRDEVPPSPRLEPRRSPIPEVVAPGAPVAPPGPPSGTRDESGARSLIKGGRQRRFETPGLVRWRREFDGTIRSIRWTPLAGLIVSAGDDIYNVTSRGERRFRLHAGEGHRCYEFDEVEILWSPAYHRLSALQRRGRFGWKREWRGCLASDERSVYLMDASTVALLRSDGGDRWRAWVEGIRELEGPFPCEGGALFHGLSGLQRVAVFISRHGAVRRRIALGRGAVLVGASPACEPMVWHKGYLSKLDVDGRPRWRLPYADQPTVFRVDGGFVVVGVFADGAREAHILDRISDAGVVVRSGTLPVSSRVTRALPVQGEGGRIVALGLCLDVNSLCSRSRTDSGRFNTLVTADGSEGFRVFVRHVKGSLDMAEAWGSGLVVASAPDDRSTELTRRALDGEIVWRIEVPGRLTAGPYLGPYGGVYVATCRGWKCRAPYELFAVTGRRDETDR